MGIHENSKKKKKLQTPTNNRCIILLSINNCTIYQIIVQNVYGSCVRRGKMSKSMFQLEKKVEYRVNFWWTGI